MSEPNFAHNCSAAELGESSDQTQRLGVLSPSEEQLALPFELPVSGAPRFDEGGNPGATSPPSEPFNQSSSAEPLLAELVQLRSLTHEQRERICNLEQALDQSLTSLSELRLEMIDQELLETQLASTEEIANIQQQAITRLKLQLAQQQQAFDARLDETALQTLLEEMEALTQTQQAELEQLRTQMSRDRAEVQTYRNRLEKQLSDLQGAHRSQQQRILDLESQCLSGRVLAATLEVWLDQAQTQVRELAQSSADAAAFKPLAAQLHHAHTALQRQPKAAEALRELATANESASSTDRLATAQVKIGELETQITQRLTTQAMLQHTCQELTAERDRQQLRIAELESQTADMQEQVLRQAQQASEYETAVQHWKDRYVSSRSQMQQLKERLEETLPQHSTVEIPELLATLEDVTASTPDLNSPAILSSVPRRQETQLDLPEFLMRRRSYKTRRSSG